VPIEEQDLITASVAGMPLATFLVKTRLDMLTNELLPEGCKDREKFEKDFSGFLAEVAAMIDAEKQLQGKLLVPEEPSGLIVP
jgi:hypothetical protein